MNLIQVTLWNPHDKLISRDTWYQEVSDSTLSELRAIPRGDECGGYYADKTYDLVMGSGYMPLDCDDPLHDQLFVEIGADDECTRALGWKRQPPRTNISAVFKVLYLFDD